MHLTLNMITPKLIIILQQQLPITSPIWHRLCTAFLSEQGLWEMHGDMRKTFHLSSFLTPSSKWLFVAYWLDWKSAIPLCFYHLGEGCFSTKAVWNHWEWYLQATWLTWKHNHHSSPFSTSLPLVGNSGRLAWVRHSSRKSSATHSCQRVWYFCVSKKWYGCQCLEF